MNTSTLALAKENQVLRNAVQAGHAALNGMIKGVVKMYGVAPAAAYEALETMEAAIKGESK